MLYIEDNDTNVELMRGMLANYMRRNLDFAAIEEDVSHADRLVEQPARIAAQVEDQALHLRIGLLQGLVPAGECDGGVQSDGPQLGAQDGGTDDPVLVGRQDGVHPRYRSEVVQGRCSMCHTAEPVWEGIAEAPKNVILDNDIAIANHAEQVAIQAGYSHAMPPGNVTDMTDEERALLVAWFRGDAQ